MESKVNHWKRKKEKNLRIVKKRKNFIVNHWLKRERKKNVRKTIEKERKKSKDSEKKKEFYC